MKIKLTARYQVNEVGKLFLCTGFVIAKTVRADTLTYQSEDKGEVGFLCIRCELQGGDVRAT